MGVDWLGGGLVIALAAALWLAYLLPTWFRRNEYMATERNAVRLQQTLRILAQTSEVPEEVRVEANARSVVEQQRRLKKVIMENTPSAVVQASRIRRSRALTSGLLLVSVVTAVLGGMQIALTGAWIVMLAGVLVSVVCVLRLAKLARMGRALRLPVEQTGALRRPAASEFADHGADFETVAEDESDSAAWTPVVLPRPLYLSRRAPAGAARSGSTADAAEQDETAERLRAASMRAQEALRQAALAEVGGHDAVEVAARAAEPIPGSMPEAVMPPAVETEAPAVARAQPASRYASMGVVDAAETPAIDLDKVMARRRAV